MIDLEFYGKRLVHFLKGLREREGLTQELIAKKINMSQSSISRLDGDKLLDLSVRTIIGLAALSEMSSMSSFFLYLEKNQTSPTDLAPWQRECLANFLKISDDNRMEFMTKVFHESSERQELLLKITSQCCKLSDDGLEAMALFLKSLEG